MEDQSELAEAKVLEAAHAAAVAHQANSNARDAQMHDSLYKALREILTEGDEGTKKLLIQKIPLLCSDMMALKNDMKWIKWLLMGITGGIGLLALKTLGA